MKLDNNMLICTITSPKKTKVYKNVRSITVPAFLGQMQILPGHAESFILLQKGKIVLRLLNNQTKTIPITLSECYIKDNRVVLVL